MRRRDLVNSGRSWTLIALTITACDSWLVAATAAENTAAENRLTSSVQYLASDELEGRGVGTKGIDLAADYIADQFHQIGLKTDLVRRQPFQKFTIPFAIRNSNATTKTRCRCSLQETPKTAISLRTST